MATELSSAFRAAYQRRLCIEIPMRRAHLSALEKRCGETTSPHLEINAEKGSLRVAGDQAPFLAASKAA